MPSIDAKPDERDCDPQPLQEARARFGLLIGGVYRQWRRQVDLSFDDGLSEATRTPLLALHAHAGPMRQKDLADALFLDTSSLVRVLRQLRVHGLVDWTRDPADRRAKCIVLTEAGAQKAAHILGKSMQIERAILQGLSPDELAMTRAVLLKISQQFAAL